MIGLEVDGRPLLRAYSMASSNYDDALEFFSIKVEDGPLTSRLRHLSVGDKVLVGRKPVGTLIQDNLLPGETLYLLATGTGLAPFLSIIKDPTVYERFERIVLVHGCRTVGELAYADFITEELPRDEFLGDLVRGRLLYYPTVTRETFRHVGRIPNLLRDGTIARDLHLQPLDRARDRVMLCGSPPFLVEMTDMLTEAGFEEGSTSAPGHFVVEKAFVER